MRTRTESATSAKSMDVLIIIDTEYVKEHFPNPSQDPNNPTGIDHNSQYMICTGTRGVISGQGTADLNFKANPGDFVSVFGQSIYANADDAVIIYDLRFWNGTKVFNTFTVDLVTRQHAVQPNIDSSNGLPAMTGPDNFISLDSRVKTQGTENFYVCFALYTLADDGETQVLYGYYYWDPTITVS
jgi:nematocidal protein AidA